MKGSLYYMSGLETYLYNDIIHDNNTALVRKNSGENDNLNQNGILNLYNLNLKKYGVYILRVKHTNMINIFVTIKHQLFHI